MLDRAYALLSIKALDGERRIDYRPGLDADARSARRHPRTARRHLHESAPAAAASRPRTPGRPRHADRDAATGSPSRRTLPDIAEPGVVRDRVNEAWHSIKAGLITGVSIGFRPLADGVKTLASGGMHLLAHGNLRALARDRAGERRDDDPHDQVVRRAPSGRVWPHPARRLGPADESRGPRWPTAPPPNTFSNLENKRAAIAARMAEIMETRPPTAGETLDAEPAAGARRAERAGQEHRRRPGALARAREAADHDARRRRPRRAGRAAERPTRRSRSSRTCRSGCRSCGRRWRCSSATATSTRPPSTRSGGTTRRRKSRCR